MTTTQPVPPRGPAAPLPAERGAGFVVFLAALVLHLTCATIGWHNAPLDGHEFRQTQTAITIRYLARDGLTLDYPTPLLGPPWSIPLELPVHQLLSAVVVKLTGCGVPEAGRAVGLGFFYLTLPALAGLASLAGFSARARWLGLAVLLTSPLYLFYSRAVMIESTALCFSAWFLRLFWGGLRGGSPVLWAAAALLGGIGAAIKLPTFAVFVPAALLATGREKPGARGLVAAGATLVLALAGGLAWTAHADKVKAANELATFLTSGSVRAWATGPLGLRFTAEFWQGIGRTVQAALWGWPGWLALATAGLFAAPAVRWRLLGCLALVLPGPLVFANVYLIHDYYFFGAGVFLAAAAAAALAWWLGWEAVPRLLRWPVVLACLGWGVFSYARSYYRLLPENETRVPEVSRALQAVTSPDDVIVVVGQDWNPVLPYTADRRALMLPFQIENNRETVGRAFERLQGWSVGALVATGPQRQRLDLLQPALRRFGLSPVPVLRDDHTDVYLPAATLSRSVAALDQAGLRGFRIDLGGSRLRLDGMDAAKLRVFAMMAPAPREVTAQFGLGTLEVDGRAVYSAHPATELVFDVPVGARRLHVGFGILPGAIAGPKVTDGVEFSAVCQDGQGAQVVVFDRHLRPATQPGDRGTQTMAFDLPAGPDRQLVLRTSPGPANDFGFDWAYWSAVRIE